MFAVTRICLVAALVGTASAFAPSQQLAAVSQRQSSSQLEMGLFDFFSEDAKAERKAADEKRKEEEEEGYRQMMQRRTNPEVMEEYEANVVVRRDNYKNMKNKLEEQQEDVYIAEEEK